MRLRSGSSLIAITASFWMLIFIGLFPIQILQAQSVLPGDPPFYPNPNSDKLIVFIHGVNGDPTGTWTHKDAKFFWPKELSKDPSFQNADVLSFGYKSECGPTLIISEIAKNLELTLNKLMETQNYKSLEFVAHSMGGLVT